MSKKPGSSRISGFINLLAEFLSTWRGFLATFLVLIAGIAIGAALQFDENYMFAFNIFLSISAIVISGVILVAGARSEAALHVKLDYLIENSKATDRIVGIEHKDAREIEEERQRVEKEAAEMIEDVLEDAERAESTPRPSPGRSHQGKGGREA